MSRSSKPLSFPFVALIAALALLCSVPFASAHDESIPCTLDMVIDKDRVTAELHFPLQSLLDADAWSDTTDANVIKSPKSVKEIDRDSYVKSKAAMLLKGLHITFDSVPLAGKVTQISAEDLVIGVSTEDIDPRPTAVCKMEFRLEKPAPPPKLVTVNHDFLPQPNDGSNIIVVCMINRKQVDRKALFPIYIANDDRMTMKLDWAATTQPATAPSTLPSRTQVFPSPLNGFTAETQRRGEGSQLQETSPRPRVSAVRLSIQRQAATC